MPRKTDSQLHKLDGSNTLGPHDLLSWRGRVPQVPRRGCAYNHWIFPVLGLQRQLAVAAAAGSDGQLTKIF